MCRNAMCPNFGIPFEGYIPKGRKRTSDDRCQIRVTPGAHGRPVGETRCRYCGQSSRLASNKAVRPIARYFLSLSLPFADCPNTECQNHGVNLFETWDEDARVRPYRRTGEHTARCNRCETETASSIVLGTARKAVDHPKTQQRWRGIIDALRAGRSVADTTEYLGISNTTYHRHLARIGARLGDYHAFKNARLLHPDIANSAQPVSLYTGVMAVGPRRNRWLPPSGPLPVIVTVASVIGTAYVLAAHPCFLPRANCPDTATLEADGGLPVFEAEWDSLRHPDEDDSDPSSFGTVDRLFHQAESRWLPHPLALRGTRALPGGPEGAVEIRGHPPLPGRRRRVVPRSARRLPGPDPGRAALHPGPGPALRGTDRNGGGGPCQLRPSSAAPKCRAVRASVGHPPTKIPGRRLVGRGKTDRRTADPDASLKSRPRPGSPRGAGRPVPAGIEGRLLEGRRLGMAAPPARQPRLP